MSKLIHVLYISFVLSLASIAVNSQVLETLHNEIKQKILNEYRGKGMKELFKVYHYLYNKNYNYNSEEGINRFKIFREKVKAIEAFNAGNQSYKQGINHLSDMTLDEVKKFYNIYTFKFSDLKTKLESLRSVTLDEFDEEKDINLPIQGRSDIDWRKYHPGIRDQGQCKDCYWAIAAITTIEGNWYKKLGTTDKSKLLNFSPQHLIDCCDESAGTGLCRKAFMFFNSRKPILENDYPYTGTKGTCSESGKKTVDISIAGYTRSDSADSNFASLLKGPIGAAINAGTNEFINYKSGIFDATCQNKIDHLIVIVGYDSANSAWIVRNSWGLGWGESGYIRVKENANNVNSCMVGRYGFRPNFN